MKNFTGSFLGVDANTSTNPTVPENQVLNHVTQVVCVFILIIGGLGNALVLIVFRKQPSSRKSFEIFVVSLAAADLIGTIMLPSYHLHETLGGSFHYIDAIGCRIIFFFVISCNTVSALSLLAISIDRYIRVKWPFSERTNGRYVTLFVLLTWAFGFANGVIYFMGDRVLLSEKKGAWVCRVNFKSAHERRVFSLVTFTVQNAIPLSLMVLIYSLIAHVVYKRSKTSADDLDVKANNQNQKLVKLLVVMVIVFFVCTSPYNVFMLLYAFNVEYLRYRDVYSMYALLTMLQMANSCANPIIYSRMLAKFRSGVLKLIYPRFSSSHRMEAMHSTVTSTFERASLSSRSAANGNRKSIRFSPVDGKDLKTPSEHCRRAWSGCEVKENLLCQTRSLLIESHF